MATWKKASKVNQHIHRERHQPKLRSHLGLLEKKKDYKSRANAFHRKQEKLLFLKKRAETRNPDEFHFHMKNSRLKDGKHEESRKAPTEDTWEQRKLLENKSKAYINMKRTIEAKKVERMRSELHLIGVVKNNLSNHVFFDEDGDPTGMRPDEVADRTDLAADLYLNGIIPKLSNQLKERRYKNFTKKIERSKQLGVIHDKMEMHQALKRKSSFRPKLVQKATADQAPIYRWKYERKK